MVAGSNKGKTVRSIATMHCRVLIEVGSPVLLKNSLKILLARFELKNRHCRSQHMSRVPFDGILLELVRLPEFGLKTDDCSDQLPAPSATYNKTSATKFENHRIIIDTSNSIRNWVRDTHIDQCSSKGMSRSNHVWLSAAPLQSTLVMELEGHSLRPS